MTPSRRSSGPTSLVDFEWPRMTRPHWIEAGRTLLAMLDDIPGDAVILSGQDGERYRPLEEEPALFLKFAALNDSEEEFERFAEAYGDLGSAGYHMQWDYDEVEFVNRPFQHTLRAWSGERQLLARAVRLWKALQSGRLQDVLGPDVQTEPSQSYGGSEGWVQLFVRYPLTSDDFGDEAWSYLRELPSNSRPRRIIQEALARVVTGQSQASVGLSQAPALTPATGDVGLRLTYSVSSLRNAMWLQLALAIDGDRRYETCPVCGEQWDATDSRSDRQTCSDRCRKRRSRDAKATSS